tara:strand:- start:542 stop:697 length:156 start_codon:yes stop_codon:yes gene_type:complete
MTQPAIQNLDYIRELIEAVRAADAYDDMQRLRMFYDLGVGTDNRSAPQEDQ